MSVDFGELYRRMDQTERALEVEDQARCLQILDERALAIAADRDEAAEIADPVQLFAFSIGAERFAVPLEHAQRIVSVRGLSRLVGSPKHVLGTVISRSRVVTVLDLRVLLGLPTVRFVDLSTVVVVEGEDGPVGLAAEEVEGVTLVSRAKIAAAPRGPFVGIDPDRRAVLDVSRLVSRRQDSRWTSR